MTTLSAAIAALTILPSPTFKVSHTDTKLIAPPICLADNAEHIFHPFSPNGTDNGMILYVMIVLIIVENAPTTNANNNDPVSVMTLRRFESNRRSGIASGMRLLLMKSSEWRV